MVVAALVGGYAVVPLRGERWWLGAGIGVVALVATAPLAARRLKAVLASERPVLEAFEALVLVLAMLIIGFAALYYALDHDGGQFTGLDTRIDAMYFTVTTLSTVGFGDVSATGQAARVLVTIQMLFDLAVVGVAVRIFATAARHRAEQRSQRT
jgi:voltage-gated potassium channel